MARRSKKYNIPKDESLTGKEKGVIYTRVSSPNQLQTGNGEVGQEKMCRIRAEENKVEIVRVFFDGGVSGKFTSREELDKMIDFLTKENKAYTKIQFVIVDDVDRIVRDVAGWREIKLKIQTTGAKIFSLKQQIEETPEGVLNQNIVMSFKQYERENNARRVKDRQRARMLDGYRPLYQPPGYEYINGPRGGRILKLGPDAEIIKEGLELFGRGIIQTQEKLKEFFNKKEYKSRRGNKIHHSFIERLIEKDRLLFYAGFINYPDWDINMVVAKHPAIIDLSTVNNILDRFKPRTFYQKCSKSDIGVRLPLRGFLFDTNTKICYSGGPSKGKKKLYFFYSCRFPQKNEDGKKTINIRDEIIHKEFADYLDRFKIDEDILVLLENIMMKVWKDKEKVIAGLSKDKEKRIFEIDEEVRNVMSKIKNTKNEKMIEIYESEIITLTEEKEEIQLRIKETDINQDIDIKKLISNTKSILTNPRFIRDLKNLELQRMLIGILFNGKIYYNKKTGFQTPEIPLIYADLKSLDLNNSQDLEMARVELASKRHK